MAVDYTTTGFLDRIRRRGMLPDSGDALDDTDLLAFASEVQLNDLVPLLLDSDGERLVVTKTLTYDSTSDRVAIPSDAYMGRLRDIRRQDGDGWLQLFYVEPESDQDFTGLDGQPIAYTIEGDEIVLLPAPDAAGTLQVKIYRRPSELVPVASCSRIFDFVSGVGTINLNIVGGPTVDSWTSTPFDIVAPKPPFKVLGTALAGANVTGQLQIADTGIDQSALQGAYVCPTGQTCFPQLPYDLWSLWVQETCVAALEAIGDPKFQASQLKVEKLEQKTVEAMTPREDGTARTVVNRFGPGWRNSARRFRR